jgi:hypothetical protein
VIVVVGSRHDSAATSMVAALPGAALCGADDLTRPGWVWELDSPEASRWVVAGDVVDDRDVTGVFVRRTYVYPEELVTTHPEDREYLAAEATAFLIFVLSRTGARVVNPVGDGGLGNDVVRPERWMRAAVEAGVKVAALRLHPDVKVRPPAKTTTAEVVSGDAFGDAPPRLRSASIRLAATLGLLYARFVFDGAGRLVAISPAAPPSQAGTAALGPLLGRRRIA